MDIDAKAYSGWQYIAGARRSITALRCARGLIHIYSGDGSGNDPSREIPALTADEARGLAARLVFLADELDELDELKRTP